MQAANYIWIRTRDGSPTLWSNALGESFRSVRGAFTESWTVFVEAALTNLPALSADPVCVGEFGLGTGLNWLFWSLAAGSRGLSFTYFAIEKDVSSFEMGRKMWLEKDQEILAFLQARGLYTKEKTLAERMADLANPLVFPSLEAAQKACPAQCQIWFHDPFGFEVNPEGYSAETLHICDSLWDKTSMWGASYACNRFFQKKLQELDLDLSVVPTGDPKLKRERLEFRRSQKKL